jgi:hypothetical protein
VPSRDTTRVMVGSSLRVMATTPFSSAATIPRRRRRPHG